MAVSVPKLLLANVGGTELFKYDYEYNLQLDNQIPDLISTNKSCFTGGTSQRSNQKQK